MAKALIVIDLQHDYFEGGAFPLWNTDTTLENVVKAIELAQKHDIPVVHIQHVADPAKGMAPFFNDGTNGVEIHPRILAAAPDAPVVKKSYADSFEQTDLKAVLDKLGVDELLLCGMMTQNCVTHTALSRSADAFKGTTVLTDCTTTVDKMLHLIALNALSTRVTLAPSSEALH